MKIYEVKDYILDFCDNAVDIIGIQNENIAKQIICSLHNLTLSDIQKNAVDKWSEYGWVPILPSFKGNDVVENIFPPDSKELADKYMLGKLNDDEIKKLYDEIHNYIISNKHNINLFEDAVRKDLHELTGTYKKTRDIDPADLRGNLASDIWELRGILREAGYDRNVVNT